MNTNSLKITGGCVGVLLMGTLYGHIRKRRKDNLASQLFGEISKIINPATKGLVAENAFDIHYLDKVLSSVSGKVLTLKPAVASRFATRIHNAWGAWYQGGDDEAKVYAVFRELQDKVQVSQVAQAYQKRYGENLIDKLHDRFTSTEVKKVLDIVKPLPAYSTL